MSKIHALSFCFFLPLSVLAQNHYDVSVAGFRPGMSQTEVRSAMKPGYKELPITFGGNELTGFAEQKGDDSRDILFFVFFKGILTGIEHHVEFAKGQEILRAQLIADLKEKYGSPIGRTIQDHALSNWHYHSGVPADYSRTPLDSTPACNGNFQMPYTNLKAHSRGFMGFELPSGNGPCSTIEVVLADYQESMENNIAHRQELITYLDIALFDETPVHNFLLAQLKDKDRQNQKVIDDAKARHAPM